MKTELMTLKDIECDESGKGDFVCESRPLSYEAIEWIKAFKNHTWEHFSSDKGYHSTDKNFIDIQNWIKHFFNINESELK